MKRLFLTSVLLTVLSVASFPHTAHTAISNYLDTVQKVYIGYYQRPADPAGLLYWAQRLDSSGGNLNDIIQAYANSPESQALYGTITSSNISTVVNGIYRAFFNRSADAGGLAYYLNGFISGQFSAATIMLNVLNGAQGTDMTCINNKLAAANLFTKTIDPDLDGKNFQVTYAGNQDVIKARAFLAAVTDDPGSVPTQAQVTAWMKTNIADSGDPIFNPPSQTTTISGIVAKGPVTGATVSFYTVATNGAKDILLDSTTTDATGHYTISLIVPSAPLLAEATGGSYVNEVAGATDVLSATDTLSAVLPAGTTAAAVTPLTTMAASRAVFLAAAGTSLATAIGAANTGVAQQYDLPDILGTIPVAANDAAQMATSTRDQRNYGIVLAGIAQEAAILNVRPIDLAVALAIDIEDGLLDGLGQNPIPLPTNTGAVINLPANAGVAGLQTAINTFLASGNNLTNLAGMNINPLPVNINPLGGGFYIDYTALPAATSGQSYTATLHATGGTPPYNWTATGLPAWLALTPAGVLAGTAPALAAGSTMSISPSFSIRCTDASSHSQAINFTVTTTTPPPTVSAVQAACQAGGQVNAQVASATGGVPPYYYFSPSFMYGAPPLGTSVWTDGTLRGTCPATPGDYSFPACAADKVGSYQCTSASLQVAGALIGMSLNVTSVAYQWLSSTPPCTVNISIAGQACGPVYAYVTASYVSCSQWTGGYCMRAQGDPECTTWSASESVNNTCWSDAPSYTVYLTSPLDNKSISQNVVASSAVCPCGD